MAMPDDTASDAAYGTADDPLADLADLILNVGLLSAPARPSGWP